MTNDSPLLGAIEAGGTKFLCAVSDSAGCVLEDCRIPTTSPDETLSAVRNFFAKAIQTHGPLSAVGIGSFGPLSLNPLADNYGHITSTPKRGWQDTDLLGHLRPVLRAPIALDTDVNCAAIGEHLFGNGRGHDTFCYVTVGTGIGVGVFVAGAPHGGANHPEAGHIMLPRATGDTDFAGTCPFHGDCLEGLACGPAMHARWGQGAETLPPDHQAWDIEADYIAGLCATLTYTIRPDRIILGGGVMAGPSMYDRVRQVLAGKLAGYDSSIREMDLQTYVAQPTAGESAGLSGALALAHRTATRQWPAHWKVDDPATGQSDSVRSANHA